MKAVNAYVVPSLTNSFGIIKWPKWESASKLEIVN
jgi:hypothetical protein